MLRAADSTYLLTKCLMWIRLKARANSENVGKGVKNNNINVKGWWIDSLKNMPRTDQQGSFSRKWAWNFQNDEKWMEEWNSRCIDVAIYFNLYIYPESQESVRVDFFQLFDYELADLLESKQAGW